MITIQLSDEISSITDVVINLLKETLSVSFFKGYIFFKENKI